MKIISIIILSSFLFACSNDVVKKDALENVKFENINTEKIKKRITESGFKWVNNED